MDRVVDGGEMVAWRRVDGWVFRVMGGKVLLAAPGGRQRELAGMATVVWVVLDRPASVEEIAGWIADALGPEADRGLLIETMDRMAVSGLITDGVGSQLDRAVGERR